MAKITNYEGKIPKRIGNLVFYESRGQLIVRTNSGFTSESLKNDAKYANARNTATEFGKVSSLCKGIRVALATVLPKQNSRSVISNLTKKMYEVMTHDLVSAHGERNLANALNTETGRMLLTNYDFNPDASVLLNPEIIDNIIRFDTAALVFPAGANCVGFRAHLLAFDFTTTAHQLESSDWLLHNKSSLPDAVALNLPVFENGEGVVFSILETAFFKLNKEGYEPIGEELKSVRIIIIC